MGKKTLQIDEDIRQPGVSRGHMSRRGFMGLGAMALGAAAISATGCSPVAPATAEPADSTEPAASAEPTAATPVTTNGNVKSVTGWTGTPEAIAKLGGSTMPLADLNNYRKEYVDKQTEYTLEDGTVIPAVYAKMRALIHTYGIGSGNTLEDMSFMTFPTTFSEEDAATFLELPWGVEFTAMDMHVNTGKDLNECTAYLDRVAEAGFLTRATKPKGVIYHMVPYFQGITEYTAKLQMAGGFPGIAATSMAAGTTSDASVSGTPTFYAVPCDASVTDTGTILPYDDLQKLVMTKDKLAIAPCICRCKNILKEGTTELPSFEDFFTGKFEDFVEPSTGQRVETCLMMGDEAEFWVSMGLARYITQEQAARYMKRSCDDGFILEHSFGKEGETICSCHIDSCNVLRGIWMAIGSPEDIATSSAFGQVSHYTLDVDFEKCIKCGTCVGRCPLHAITLDGEVDGETGYPEVGPMCFRCGQCAYVCPQSARKLVQRPDDEILELPENFLDDNNMKAAYRFEHGLIY